MFISTRDKAKLLVKRCTFAKPTDFSEMLFLKLPLASFIKRDLTPLSL